MRRSGEGQRTFSTSGYALALALLAIPASAGAQDNAMCMMCHGNAALFAGRADAARLLVDLDVHTQSVHGVAGLQCVNCHTAFTGFPHPEERPPVDCAVCHSSQARQHAQSLHGQAAARGDPLAPGCTDCHGRHDILSQTDPESPTSTMNIPFLCGECHHEGSPVSLTRDIPQEQILENYSLSIHGEGLFRQGLSVTAVCTSCHTSHLILPHTDPRSSIHRDRVAGTCTSCHTLIEQVHRKFIEGRLWEEEPEKIPACVECHSPHEIRRVFYEAGAANKDCLACHSDPELTMLEGEGGDTIALYVDESSYNASTHSGTACAQCHTEVTSSLVRACETIVSPVDCSICHAEQVEEHRSSTHGQLAAEGYAEAPTCLDCHEKHATKGRQQPASATFARNVPELCARCHRQGEAAARRIDSDIDIIRSYEMSIHGKGLLESGLVVTATCTNCHTAHGPLPPDDPRSTVHNDNVASTCGNCHYGIEEAFKTSIHWPGNGEVSPDRDLPTCEDCHTSHNISRTDRDDFRLMMMDQCGNCHTDEAETFFDTFHGKVSRLGDAGVAKCFDCHGTHNILPVSSAASTLSRRNIVETCSQCHSGAHRRFTGYLTHATHHDSEKYPVLFWTFWGMTALVVTTLSFAFLHTIAWLWRLWRSPEEWKPAAPGRSKKQYRRFTTLQRTYHIVMLISFFTLALTGMALKFSYMGWAQRFAALLGGFSTTGVLHRLGAITLMTVFVIHLWDAWRKKRESGLSWMGFISSPNSLIFNKNDLGEFIGSIRWFVGIGPRPKYGRYSYWEKFDYFSVFWGMFIIGATGLILWFPETFTYVLPGWWVNVATILHSDEALLAVAFIFTVHFFNTHFRPDKFPMDPVIFTGRVPLEEFKVDKPREYEALVTAGKLQAHLVDPYPEGLERAFRIFAYLALGVGLTLIFLIVYTMLFGYR